MKKVMEIIMKYYHQKVSNQLEKYWVYVVKIIIFYLMI